MTTTLKITDRSYQLCIVFTAPLYNKLIYIYTNLKAITDDHKPSRPHQYFSLKLYNSKFDTSEFNIFFIGKPKKNNHEITTFYIVYTWKKNCIQIYSTRYSVNSTL